MQKTVHHTVRNKEISVVGIGASAGGLEALQELLSNLPPNTGAAYVVVQHLPPSYKSMLSHILARETKMQVKDIKRAQIPKPNTVYVVSPNKNLVFEKRCLTPKPVIETRLPKPSIDLFFQSIAEQICPHAIGVILSGTGSDGALGLRAIRAQGGFTFAQEPNSAKYDGMPLAAIKSHAVDWTLAPKAIANHITNLLRRNTQKDTSDISQLSINHRKELIHIINRHLQINFEGYKQSTLDRRIQRRAIAAQCQNLEQYLTYCQNSPKEIEQLAGDMLISVTRFFRDTEAFAALGDIIEERLRKAGRNTTLRIWVPACASGEEAYSIAILLEEKAKEHDVLVDYKIFAIDIDETALEIAKRGLYSAASIKGINEKYRGHYFQHQGDQYKISKSVRENVIFSRYNIISDPPFSRLDLISCRNFLIYLKTDLQTSILRKFHYILAPKSMLFLGKSESINKEDNLFYSLNNSLKLCQRKHNPDTPAGFSLLESNKNKYSYRSALKSRTEKPSTKSLSLEYLANSFGPPSIIMDEKYNLIYSHGEIGEFVHFPQGEMNMHLKNIIPEKWYNEAQALLYQSIKQKTVVRGVEHPYTTEQGDGLLTLVARTHFDEASIPSLLLLSFEWRVKIPQISQLKDMHGNNCKLQYQLNLSNEHLEAVIKEHNTTVEEMNALNEELQAANEELIQKNTEAENLSKYLESVQNSIPVALLIVSSNLQLQRFNKTAAKIFHLDSSAIGKSLVSLPSKIAIERILSPLRSVFSHRNSNEIHREIIRNEEKYYQLNINGFCNTEEKASCAIIALLDISEQYLAEKRAERSEMQLLSMMNHSPTLIYQKDLRGRYSFVNDTFVKFFSLTREQCIGRTDEQLFDPDLATHFRKKDLEALDAYYKHYQANEEEIHFNNAGYWFLGNRTPLMSSDGIINAIIWNAIDITERKHMELEAEKARKELRLQYHLRDSLLHQREDYVAAIDKHFNYLMVTPAFAKIMRELYNVDVKEGDNIKNILKNNSDSLTWLGDLWERALNERFTDIFEYSKDKGDSRYLKYEMIPVRHHDNSILGAAVFARDVTNSKKAELALKYSEQVYRSLIKNTDTGYVTLDLSGKVLDANPEYLRLSGYRKLSQIQGCSPLDWTYPDDIKKHQEELSKVISGGDMKNLQLRFRNPRGRITPVESNATILDTLKGKQIIIWCRDIKERVEQQRKIEQMAYYDSLTGLENRVMLTQQLKKAIQFAERHNGRLAVMFVDLDRFKHINDSLGHEVGDEVLKRVAERLKSSVRASDTIGRLGSDEFLCVLSELTDVEHDSICISQKLLRALSLPYKIGAHELHLSVSIGISIFPDNGTDATTLIKNADAAMYQIKENGRDDYVFYSPAMNDRSHAFVTMGNKLRSAIAKGQLELYFQPQFRLSTNEMVAAEALLRWRHPEQGMIPPAMFIPVAEDIGLMKALGFWILDNTCVQLREWQSKKLPMVPISINVSARQCRDKWVEEEVLHCLEKHNIDPQYLQLEFTESSLIANSQEAQTMLRKLKTLGIKTAIDDFGTGYSSLSYLKQFPIDKLKIDKSFILDIGRDEGDETIVAAIIGLAKNLKMSVLAEGVETKEQLLFLQKLECDEAQGFYYHTALESEHFLQLLLQRKRGNIVQTKF